MVGSAGIVAVAALSLLVSAVLSASVAGAQPEPPGTLPPVELILDASGSMNGDDGTGRPKIDAAKEALATLVDSLPEAAPVGLRVYGHRVPNPDKANGCTDTELIVPVGPLDKASMRTRIDSFAATGFTPIGLSLQQAAADLPPEGPRSIILVSDGVDTCAPPDPCQVARDLAAQGIDLRIEAVGFQVDAEAAEQLRCIAEATGGSYVDAPDAQRLTEGLARLSARALRTYVPLGTPVQGGSGPTCEGAPTIAPGQFVDSMRKGEERWYAVELQRGQSLEASGTLILVGRNSRSSYLDVEVFDSTGSEDVQIRDVLGGSKNVLTGGVIGDPLGDDEGGLEPGEGSDKGLHCLRLATTNLDEDVTFPP
jgi:Ca-activated chloride channel family protein